MTKKVTLPREVAEAIEGLRFNLSMGELELLDIETMRERYERGNDGWYGAIIKHHDAKRLDYIRAIINGYEIEKSPEEKLREYYRDANVCVADSQTMYSHGVRDGILRTLSLLGIQIEGINA